MGGRLQRLLRPDAGLTALPTRPSDSPMERLLPRASRCSEEPAAQTGVTPAPDHTAGELRNQDQSKLKCWVDAGGWRPQSETRTLNPKAVFVPFREELPGAKVACIVLLVVNKLK